MKNQFLPLFVAPCDIRSKKTVFYHANKEIEVEAPGRLVKQLIRLCDGFHFLEAILNKLKKEWDEDSLRGLIEKLRTYGIMTDSRSLHAAIWKDVENPSHLSSLLSSDDIALLVKRGRGRFKRESGPNARYASDTPLSNLINIRRSVRSFSEETIKFQSIINLLWSAYGEVFGSSNNPKRDNGRRSIPSAGALYPLHINVAILKDTEEISTGVYTVHMGSPGAVELTLLSRDINRFIRTFANPLILKDAQGVVVISGSFDITGKKYGNRSMLYVPLEAGHAAQNILLMAAESDIATLEIGGFMDQFLTRTLKLPKHYHPMITIAFGKEGAEEIQEPAIEVQWAIPPTDRRYEPPFAIVSVRMSKELDWSGGRDNSPFLAYTKAVAEAKEWTACGGVPNTLTNAKFIDLDNAVDPRTIIRFHPDQYCMKHFPFKPFNENQEYAWTEAQNEQGGTKAYILADLVYFPYFPETPYYAYANSSGVAAHPVRQKAVELSTLELIERDSFMTAYLTRLEFPTILPQTLPQSIKKRIQALEDNGFHVWIKDHSLDLAPVVCVVAQSDELGSTTCASCASFDPEYAVDHALMEVESFVLARLQETDVMRIKPVQVRMPSDHGTLYNQREYFHRADFLIQGIKTTSLKYVGRGTVRSWQKLLDRFLVKDWHLFTISLHLPDKYGGNGNLNIIRSVVPGIVPMTFGYRQESGGMERIYEIARIISGKSFSYRDLTKFPHPFA